MQNVVKALPFTGRPTDGQIRILRKAKEELDLDYLVRMEPAKPGTAETYLAFEDPDWYPPNGYGYVKTVDTVARMKPAAAQVLGEAEPTRLTTPEKWLSYAMGIEVVKDG